MVEIWRSFYRERRCDMSESHVWPGWETERVIKESKVGPIYEIKRRHGDDDISAASLKVIRVAHNEENDNDKTEKASYDIASACLDNKKLDSDNIVRYEDVRYIQHFDGVGFDILIKTEPLLPLPPDKMDEEQTVKLAVDICTALTVCEKHGVVHGRINENSIYLSESGAYKLDNAGIALMLAEHGLIISGEFDAPEVEEGSCDNRSDIFSLGAIMNKLLNKDHDSDHKASLPDDERSRINAIIAKATAKDPNERYQTAQEMLDDLKGTPSGMVIPAPKSKKRVLKALGIFASLILWMLISALLALQVNSILMAESVHNHGYYSSSDPYQHWTECSCGKTKNREDHTFFMVSDSVRHWNECSCGRINGYREHIYNSWNVVTEATEESEGLKTSTCAVCNYNTSVIIPALVHTHVYSDEIYWNEISHWKECACGEKNEESFHNYSSWTVIKPATIYETGMQERVCSLCGYVESQVIPVIDHTHSYSGTYHYDTAGHWRLCSCGEKSTVNSHLYGEWVVTKNATIYESGSKYRICDQCGYTQSEAIPKLQHTHSYTSLWESDSTGHWRVCSCGATDGFSAHTYPAWTVTKAATIYDTGLQERSCRKCGYKETEVIPKLQHTHSYTGVWIVDDNNHWQECSCGYQGKMSAHSYGSWTVVKEANASETGLKRRTCTSCSYCQTEVIPIDTHTHNYSGGWQTSAYYHWMQCSCGERASYSQHSYSVWTVTKEATTTSEGVRQRICSVCGYKQTESIPVLLEIASLTLVSKPKKLDYVVGDSLDTAGLSLLVSYTNGTTEIITSGFTYTPKSFKTSGSKIITVTYREFKVVFSVNVK